MNNYLVGRRIVITGASSGIGRACALACANSGADVVMIGRNRERLEQTLHHMGTGGHAIVVADLGAHKELDGVLKSVLDGSRVDGLLACAGIREMLPARVTTADALQRAFAVNVIGNIEIARIVSGRSVMSQAGGSIVLFSSIVARSGGSGLTAYAASKSALEGAAKALASELAPRRIRVNCILPGHIQNTGMWDDMKTLTPEHVEQLQSRYPLGLGVPVDIANAALFLLSEGSRWITGTSIVVDGGYSLRA